jgi:two-component system, LytTR family, response regulator
MPRYAGYEITSFFNQLDFEIIFVTAYDHYAVKAFEISAVDYILKPIDIDRLAEAITKFRQKSEMLNSAVSYKTMMETLESESVTKYIVQTPKGQKVLMLSDIVSIEASRAYCTIYTADGQSYVLSKNLKYFESLFEENKKFIRCHKSWLVNISYLDTYSKSELSVKLTNGQEVKLSKYKKAEFEALLLSR